MKRKFIYSLAALALLFTGCSNIDDLQEQIDGLNSRVTALETQTNAINGNIEALKKLYNGATISSVSEKDGVYSIVLSNGETITLTQGSEAEAIIPVVSIDAQGNWQVSYDGGKSFTSLGVSAVAKDGATPVFRVDSAASVWQVSYDGGKSYENVKDENGKDVPATGTGVMTDRFFKSVETVTENGTEYFKVVLLTGAEIKVPVLKDFICKINLTVEGIQIFAAGESKTFDVQLRGADETMVTAPLHWTASLSEPDNGKATLTVTAPATSLPSTKGVVANTDKDVAILAISNGYACISKIQVEIGSGPVVPPVNANDLQAVFESGESLTIGRLSVNISEYKDFKTVKPGELTDAMFSDGGLIFIDNSDESKLDFTMTGTSVNAGKTKPLIMVGRYKDRKQPVLKVNQVRCNQDVSMMNMHIVSLNDQGFNSTNAMADPNLNLQDCFIEAKRYLIYDSHATHCFANIDIENSVVKFPAGVTNQPALFAFTSTAKSAGYTSKSITVNNCVMFAETATQTYIIQGGANNPQYATKDWSIAVTGNTIYNLHQANSMIRAYIAKSLTVKDNIASYTGVTAKSYLTAIFDKTDFPAESGVVSGNYLYTTPKSDANFWSLMHTGSYTPTDNTIEYGEDKTPFLSSGINPSKAWFPKDPSVVTGTAGADYDSKYYLKNY